MDEYEKTIFDRPAAVPARWRPGRILRLATGVHEETLAKVPAERSRYTAMGGVVFGTALMAMLSMSFALYCVFGGFRPFIVVVTPIWGMFILSLDRWLMSTTSVSNLGHAARRLVPRLLLSMALGIVVAEPLLLGVFNTAIQERVAKNRNDELVLRESELRTCNPVPGTPAASAAGAADPRCADLRLSIGGASPEALQKQLDDVQRQADQLKTTVDADAATYAALQQKSREECNGVPGPGLTGRRGVGLNCNRLRAEADQYHRDHNIDENSRLLGELRSQITALTDDLAAARTGYGDRVDQAIEADLRRIRDRQGGVGLLERFRTLDELVSENGYVLATQWALRIFFIIVDALPVLLKVFTGTTSYDRVLAEGYRAQERAEELRVAAEIHRYATAAELDRHRVSEAFHANRRQVSHGIRVRYANLDEARGELIDAKERSLLLAALGPSPDTWDGEVTEVIEYGPAADGTSPAEPPEPPTIRL